MLRMKRASIATEFEAKRIERERERKRARKRVGDSDSNQKSESFQMVYILYSYTICCCYGQQLRAMGHKQHTAHLSCTYWFAHLLIPRPLASEWCRLSIEFHLSDVRYDFFAIHCSDWYYWAYPLDLSLEWWNFWLILFVLHSNLDR